MTKAIIAFGVGYHFEHIKYFIHSCHVYSPKTDVYLFVGSNIGELRKDAGDYPRVHFIHYREGLIGKIFAKMVTWWPAAAKAYARCLGMAGVRVRFSKTLNALASPLTQFMVKRFFRIQQFVRSLPHEQIMITDLRDVVLQADPFSQLGSNTIITGVEPVAIWESEMNSGWLLKTYSNEAYEKLKPRAVACAGVTIGSRKAILQYADEMVHDVYQNLHKIIQMLGADQAIHIRLFYEGLKGLDVQLESNGSGSIATLHFSKLTEFRLEDGQLFNKSGKTLAVVHQYDRHKQLAIKIQDRLMAGVTLAEVA